MTESSAGEHQGASMVPYLVIFVALSVFTVVSFVVYDAVTEDSITKQTGFCIILGVAVVKALLVGIYFMHLKQDWGRLYFLIIPALILGVLLILVLMPDIVLGWHNQ